MSPRPGLPEPIDELAADANPRRLEPGCARERVEYGDWHEPPSALTLITIETFEHPISGTVALVRVERGATR